MGAQFYEPTRVTIPFETEQLWSILQDKEAHQDRYLIDVGESLNGTAGFLNGSFTIQNITNYINNLRIRVEVDASALTYEQKSELFRRWLYGKSICSVKQLTETIISIVFAWKGAEIQSASIFTKEEERRFMEENSPDIERWIVFYDSIVVYILKQFYGQGVLDADPKTQFVNVNEVGYTPINLVTVFEYEDFTMYYSELDGNHFAYLVPEFDTPYFAGQQLFDFVYGKYNPIAAFVATNLLKLKES